MFLAANLSVHHDPIMLHSNHTTPMISPHGVIGERIQIQPQALRPHTPDRSGLSIRARDDISVTQTRSQKGRERDNDIFTRGPFDPFSRWSNKPTTDVNGQDDGWDRASANHFASRPQSPRKSQMLYDTPQEPPKTALPTFPAFTPIITPPAPQSLLLPAHSTLSSPSPPRSERGREVVAQASQHLSSLQALIGPLVGQLDELERLKEDLVLWKASSEAASMEVLSLKAKISLASKVPIQEGPTYIAMIIDGDSQIFQATFLRADHEGGQAAAQALVDAIRSTKGEFSTLTTQIPIVIHVFLDKASLGDRLIKAGLVASLSVYEGFWQGFSASSGLVSVVDVGSVKGACRSKCQAYLEHYIAQSSCSQIILASDGHVRIPDDATSKLAFLGKISTDTTHKNLSLPHIFRSDPIPVPPISFSTIVAKPPPTITHKQYGSTSTSSSSEADAEADLETTLDWEEVSKNGDGIANDWTEARKRQNKKSSSDRDGSNRRDGREGRERGGGGRRVLAGTGTATGNDGRKERRGKRGSRKRDNGVRDMKPRPCHTYYLSPSGCQNNDCHYGHEYERDDDQCHELSLLAKQIPCPFARNKKCHYDDETCTYGHKCPRGRDCIFEDCRFDYIDPDHHAWD